MGSITIPCSICGEPIGDAYHEIFDHLHPETVPPGPEGTPSPAVDGEGRVVLEQIAKLRERAHRIEGSLRARSYGLYPINWRASHETR